MKKLLLSLSALLLLAALVFTGIYFTRFQSMATLQKITDYSDGYNLYRMDIRYRYSLNDLLARGITDDQSMVDAILEEALPLLPVTIQAPSFGCTAFAVVEQDGTACMGRNYDFRYDTSAMVVYCSPQDSYRSVAFAIRLVLDHAATTAEAVALLREYDMFASGGRDYHFYITDASGDGRVVEYDCDDPARPLVDTPAAAATNFYALYPDRVKPNQRNGIYVHGRERYDTVLKILEQQKDVLSPLTVWDALRAVAQEPDSKDITSNTQWSICFHSSTLSADVALRRHWDNIFRFRLTENTATALS